MQVKAVIKKIQTYNEKTGEARLVVCMEDKTVFVHCICIKYPQFAPVSFDVPDIGPDELEAENVHISYKDRESLITFLLKNNFAGIREATAAQIADKFGDIFSDDESDIKYKYPDLWNRIHNIRLRENVYDCIKKHHGSFHSAMRLCDEHGDASLSVLKNNPYILLKYDYNTKGCNNLAQEMNIPSYDKKRVSSITSFLMELNRKAGNTKLGFDELCKKFSQFEKGFHTTYPLFILESLMEDRFYTEIVNDRLYIYFKRDYLNEVTVAENIMRISSASEFVCNEKGSIEDLEKKYKVSYSDTQKEAFLSIDCTGIKIITGGPGTGKTTTLNGILEKYRLNHPGKEITLCAPTGRAAKRMSETTGYKACTIHRLLKIRPYESDEDYVSSFTKLDSDLIVVDEASMIDLDLMSKFLNAVKSNAIVIFLGDENQLPSVDAGNVLHDMLQSGKFEVYRLRTVFRQLKDNSILGNSEKVLKGDTDLVCDVNFSVERVENDADALNSVIQHYLEDSSAKIYAPAKRAMYPTGTVNINRLIQASKTSEDKPELLYGDYKYKIGDVVMFNTNNYKEDYYNGEEGKIVSIQCIAGQKSVTIRTENGDITLSGAQLDDIELCYAITAHKSQGGECGNAIIVIPQNPSVMLRRQLLYVEITRARKKVVIISEKDALEKCICSNLEIGRETGLTARLKQILM